MTWLFFLVDRLNQACITLACVVVFLMMMHVTADVLLQFLFSSPIPLTLEVVSYYYMLVLAFIPLAAVERKDGHIKVDIVTQFFPAVVQRLLDAMMSLLGALFFGVVAWVTLNEAIRRYNFGEYVMGASPMIVWPARFMLPIGLSIFAVVLALKGIVIMFGGQVPKIHEGQADGKADSEGVSK